jgi:uncharacterized membrane protein YccC
LNAIPSKIGFIGLGTMFSCFLALAYILSLSSSIKPNVRNNIVPILKKNIYTDFWEAIIMGGFMSAALSLGYLFKFDNPYWIPISCSAVMQGASHYHIWQRTFQRIIGTFIGLGLCWILLSIANTTLLICFFIIILQLIVGILVVRNYALAIVFVTPMAILLSEAANPIINIPNILIPLRFEEIFIGSILGAIGGWILHKEKIRYATINRLRKISAGLKM